MFINTINPYAGAGVEILPDLNLTSLANADPKTDDLTGTAT